MEEAETGSSQKGRTNEQQRRVTFYSAKLWTSAGKRLLSAVCGRRVLYKCTPWFTARRASALVLNSRPRLYSLLRMPFIRSASAFSAQWLVWVILMLKPRSRNRFTYAWQQY